MKEFHKLVSIAVVVTFFGASLLFLGQVFAQGPVDACTGDAANSPYCLSLKEDGDPTAKNGMIAKVTDIISYVAGVIGVFWIIIMGIKMATSSGNAEKISSARNGIIYAVVGLVVILVARTVINFALNRL